MKLRTAGSACVALALLASACGGSDGSSPDEGDDTTTSTTQATDEDTAEPAATSTGGDAGGELTTVQMNYTVSAEGFLAWIAEEEGFYEECGVDVELEEIAGAGLTPVALQNGEVDLGTSTAPDFLLAVEGGLDLVAAAGLSVNNAENPRLFVLAGGETGIEEAQGLEGARIATPSRGGSFEISTNQLLSERGVDPSTVTWVEVPFPQMPEALSSGTVDAVATSITLRGRLLSEGATEVLDLSNLADDEVLVTFLSARRGWAQDNAAVIDCVKQAHQQAADLAESNSERAYEIIVEYTGLPAEVASRVPLANPSIDVTAEHLQTWIDVMSEQGLLEGSLDAGNLANP